MKELLTDFRAFLNKGNVLAVAVGLVMALYFQKIVEALLDGVINPIIAAIFGKPDFTAIGFGIGDARISVGLLIDAIVSFVIVSFVLFLIVRAWNRYRGDPDAGPAGPTEVELLTEIRDALRNR